MTRVLPALTACIAGVMAGCFSPALDGFACGPAGECPQGYECSTDNLCVLPGGPPPVPDIDAAPPDPGDQEPPQASIVFPLSAGMTEAGTITVRGTASDASPIRAVSVNGVPATSQNGFREWTADVPLAQGVNVISVGTEDVLGNQGPAQASVRVERVSPLLSDPNGMAVTPDGATAVVFDQEGLRLLAIDVATGERKVISDAETGTGPALDDVIALAVTPDGTRVLALDTLDDTLISVDLATGDRELVSGDGAGSGEGFSSPRGLTVDPAGTTAYVGDQSKDVVFAVDLDTGARAVLSGTTAGGTLIGTGPDFENITALAFDAANDGVLVVDAGLLALVGVELGTGDRNVLADSGLGTGPDFVEPIGVAPAAQGNLTFVFDKGLNALVRVNEDNGNRFTITGNGAGSGVRMSDIEAMAIAPDFSRAFLTDDDYVVPLVVDLDDGARTPMAALAVGSGTALVDPQSAALDDTGERLVVADDVLNGLVVIDLATGDRTLLPEDASVSLRDPQTVVLHPDGLRAVVLNSADNMCVSVDLATGARTLIADNESLGPDWDFPLGMALDASGTAALIADFTPMLVSVDLATGERVLLSDGAAPGIAVQAPVSMILDGARNRVVIADEDVEALVAVDLATGARSELTGEGPEIDVPAAITHGATPDTAVVYDAGTGDYVLVDLVAGTRTTLYTAELRAGLPLSTPEALAVDRARNVLFAPDFTLAGVVAIDLVTGARLVVSR